MTPLGPDSISLAVSAATVPAGTVVTLTGAANDTRYKSGSGEATQAIAAAEYYLDTPPWVAGATPYSMNPSDGTFNSTTENITASVNTTGWSNGRHTLYVRSKDAANNWGAISAIFLTVEGQANQAPVISQGASVSVVMSEDGNPTPFAVIIDAIDPDGNPLTWSLSSIASHGNAAVSGNGASPVVTYTPTANYNGPDSFIVQVSDGSLTDTIAVNVTIQPVNDVPVANGQSVSTPENIAKSITLIGTDIDGDALTYTIVTQPTHGTLSGTGSSQTYTPTTNFYGSDSFTFKVNDGSVDSNTATVTITVTAVNDAPVANGQAVSTTEDTAKPITLTGTDPDGDTLTYAIVAQPAHGSLTGNAPNITYTPVANYNGSDSFTFKVNDGTLDSNIATVAITVTPVNDAPVANNQSVSTAEDTAKAIVLTGTDVDGNPLSFSIVSQPLHGTLSGSASNVTYTPAANYNGADSFTFKVNDGTVDSNTATVTITVIAVNDVPVANGQAVSTAEDTAKSITLTGSDVELSPLTYSIVSQPLHGTLSGSAPNVSYTPTANYNGSDSFTFKVNDGQTDSAPATVSITITPVNDAPIAIPQNIGTAQDTPVSITLSGSDIDGNPLTYTVGAPPSHGTLSGTVPNLSYTPNSGYVGADSFEFTVSDGTATSAPATVSISVSNVNDAPVANGQLLSTAEDTALSITLSGSDADNDPLTYRVITQPVHGILTGAAPALTFTPAENYNGTDSFTYVANDGAVDSAPATVTIDITPVNDSPVADPQQLVTSKGTPLPITLTGSDIEGSPLTFTVQTGPSHGSLSGIGASIVYTPNAGFVGDDSFIFIVNDGSLDSVPATVEITVTRTNEPPVADDQNVSINEDASLAVTLTGSDPENDPLTFAVKENPTHGSLSGSAPNLLYTPQLNYHGTDSFTFIANDGLIDSAEATIAITILPVNDTPVAQPQSVIAVEDTAKAIVLNGTDIDGDALTYTVVIQPSHGVLSGTGSNQTYTPATNYNGPDSFTFKVNDGTLDSNTATVTITVTAVNDAPVANGQAVSTAEDTAKPITLTGSDADGNPLTYSIVAQPSHGTLSGSVPNLTYSPAANYNGSDSFTFKVNDGQTDSIPATVNITTTPVNDAPIAIPQSVTVDEDTPLSIVLAGSDVDGDSLTINLVAEPTHGTLSGTVPNLVYTPGLNYNGSDSFTFSVSDGTLVSGTAVIAITVRPVNDLPVAEAQAIVTNENTPAQITLAGSDIDGDTLIYAINVAPLHGQITGALPNVTYTPDQYYAGVDVFSFIVNDGQSNSNSANVTITILDLNYLPVVFNQSLLTSEDTPLSITLTGMDPDGDTISFFTKVLPEHGTLSGTAPNLVYTPNPGYVGNDSFTFTARDLVGESNEGVISINVTASGPSELFFDDFETNLGWVRNPYGTDNATLGYFERANPESVSYYGNKQLGTTVSGSYDLVTGPLAGSSAGAYDLDGGKTSFLSPAIQLPTGRDLTLSFSYYVSHYTNSSTADYLRVYVVGDNTVKVFEELGANNNDDAVWAVSSGDISNFAGQTIRILIEAADASTASYFEAAVDDVLIVATTPNNPPVAEARAYELAEDSTVQVTLAGSDPDANAITYRVVTPPTQGTLSGSIPNLIYTPASNYNGSDSFTFVVNDGKLDSNPATISLNITAVNDAPVALEQTVTTRVNERLDVLLSGTDVDGDSLQFNITSFPANGVLSGYIPNLIYIPNDGFTGTDSFSFVVFDGIEESLPATVNITVNPAGPTTIFWDDFETNQGWIVNPNGVDTARSGTWVRANPETVSYYGYKQLGTTVSGSYDLVTGPLAGSSSSSYDLDGGLTSIRSPQIILPTGRNLTISFRYYLAHYTNSSTSDYLRVKIVGSTTSTILQELGANNDDDASWAVFTGSLNSFAGQTVYILIEAADASWDSLVEAAIDDVLIIAE